jgi:hypothetical protein
MSSKYYIHPINAHQSPEHNDLVSVGYHFGLWTKPTPAESPRQYEHKVSTKVEAQRLKRRLEKPAKKS